MEFLNQVIETHVYPFSYPFSEAAAFLLLGRDVRTAEVFCFGHFDAKKGHAAAADEVCRRACAYFRWPDVSRTTTERSGSHE